MTVPLLGGVTAAVGLTAPGWRSRGGGVAAVETVRLNAPVVAAKRTGVPGAPGALPELPKAGGRALGGGCVCVCAWGVRGSSGYVCMSRVQLQHAMVGAPRECRRRRPGYVDEVEGVNKQPSS